ncbi:hypothetical protein ACROYT_G039190 [Oculina patagonica]
MGGSLGPVLANIIMTEFKETIVKQLIDRGLITFYCRYVDDTLLLIKPDTIDIILELFHKFDKNIRFTYDLFENTTPHFLDINILTNGIGIYRKDTFTGQYTNFDSFVPWRQKISWIKALVNRIHSICSPNMLKSELKRLKTIISWNNFPSRIANALIRRFSYDALNKIRTAANKDKENSITIWLSVPYIGDKTSQLLRSFKRKLRRCLTNSNIEIKVREKTTKLCFYTNNKDRVPLLNKSHVVYKFKCPGCQSAYIGKTDRTLFVRTHEHAISDKESAIYKHLRTCNHLLFIRDLCNLPDNLNTDIAPPSISNDKEYFTHVVRDNTTPSSSEAADLYSSYIANCVFNAFSSYTAIMLNIVTIHAIRKTSSLPKPLKTLLLSLAVSDLGVGLLGQPFYVVLMVWWLQGNYPNCTAYTTYTLITIVFSLASFFGVTAISVDRFLAIHLHLRYQELVTHKRVVAVVISI